MGRTEATQTTKKTTRKQPDKGLPKNLPPVHSAKFAMEGLCGDATTSSLMTQDDKLVSCPRCADVEHIYKTAKAEYRDRLRSVPKLTTQQKSILKEAQRYSRNKRTKFTVPPHVVADWDGRTVNSLLNRGFLRWEGHDRLRITDQGLTALG